MSYPEWLTQEMVDASATEFVNTIPLKTLGKLVNEAAAFMDQPPPETNEASDAANEKLLDIVNQISDTLAPHLVCKKGCHHCCQMAVSITEYEARKIAEHLNITMHMPPPVHANSQAEYVAKYTGSMCPFLKNKECSIYEVRPLPCRTHFNISKYPEVCDIINYPGCDTPSLDLRPVWFAGAYINGMVYAFGDIREFFPYGADNGQEL